MTDASHNPLAEFQWTPQPEAEAVVGDLVDGFLQKCQFARGLAARMEVETGTRFSDWVDHIFLSPERDPFPQRLADSGFVLKAFDDTFAFTHPGGIFPRVVLVPDASNDLALRVDSVADFLSTHQVESEILGSPFADLRWAVASAAGDGNLTVIERHGSDGFRPASLDRDGCLDRIATLERFRLRRRSFPADVHSFDHAALITERALASIGRDQVCDLFFFAEREYWMRRNRAAQVQYARQQRLGLGWANHDHHTYRSSREHFTRLIAIWERLGFVCRERFYAGAEAGWGAQVMEHPVCGIVTFNDVDLSPDELMTDFAHVPLPPRRELGTVGLWCALHGESFLEAGMHHLECTFDFDALKRQLESEHAIKVMKPFTDLPHLKQAFTEGERWPVRPERIDRLLADGRITPEQAEKFRAEGAIGSHLENLERNAGFKGFNQKGVSEIIAATDPRRQ